MNRTRCCICKGLLIKCYELPKFPISFIPTTSIYDNDVFQDLIFGYCEDCGSVQLMNLIDPELLYKNPHNNSSYSNIWISHHNSFSEFISARLPCDKNIIEIGGASLELWKRLKQYKNYKIMDMTDKYFDENVEFIKGNCEDYEFKTSDAIIMSHVFEHLYNPIKFVENCKADHVFLSNPDMSSDIIKLHIEHTYYLEPIDIENLFYKHGYKCEIVKYDQACSYFVHAYKCENITPPPKPNVNRYIEILNWFQQLKTRFSIKMDDDSFISPSYISGSFLYYFSENKNIKGFIDNDECKHFKRQYGTPNIIYPSSFVKENSTVYVARKLYADEIKSNLKCKVVVM